MTLVVTVNGPKSIWILADRRLTYKGRQPKDDARKLMFLETTDGVAILGYAGLGATARGTEPADWMAAVLRSRRLTLEQSLGVLARAMRQQFPRHMIRMPGNGGPEHHIVVPAFINKEPRLYSIDLIFEPDRKRYQFQYVRHIARRPLNRPPVPPRIGMAGSGGLHLMNDQAWMRSLMHIVNACDHGKVTPHAVANHLAELNNSTHLEVTDNSVGSRCIVAWRLRGGGGAQMYYSGTCPDNSSPALPTIASGMDMNAIVGVLMPDIMKMTEAFQAGEPTPEPDKDEANARLRRIPDKPDENLR